MTTAPNLAVATLWADVLGQAGITASVQQHWASGIAGEIPPDLALPEVWVDDDEQFDAARALLDAIERAPQRLWYCRVCSERVEGAFEQCWNCGAPMPR